MTADLSADDFDHIQVDPSCGRFGCLLLIANFELQRWPKTHDLKGSRCNAQQEDDDDDGEWEAAMKPKPKRS
ncbi:hypothetical protein V6N13_090451 [Hibiscus sabdariffa]|uniref:Uncharacterized protein n=2 Tax=Hibiscus sabdariffa TaxID=183260 RepID=A0ABR2C1R4_9ROSI